jgi:hypothetical protein
MCYKNQVLWISFTYKLFNKRITTFSRVLVAHACNPSYSGGRDQEDQGLKPAQANSSWAVLITGLSRFKSYFLS